MDRILHVYNGVWRGLLELPNSAVPIVHPGSVNRVLVWDGDELPDLQLEGDFANIRPDIDRPQVG